MRPWALPAIAVFAPALFACATVHFVSENRALLEREPLHNPARPLARETRWIASYQIDGADHYTCDQATLQKIDWASNPSVDLPHPSVWTAEVLKDKDASANAVRDQNAFKAGIAKDGLSMTSLRLVSSELIRDPANEAIGREVEDLLGSAVRGPGFVGPSAPEGSILWVAIAVDAHASKGFTGRQRSAAVTLVLEQPKPIVGSSGRFIAAREYTGNVPSTPPDGYVRLDSGDSEAEAIHKDVELMLQRAASELADALGSTTR
jgi:hypothetical protein